MKKNQNYSNSIFDVVKERVPIADVVASFGLSLDSKGKGLCPFHSEKTPSFFVDEKKNIFSCFGCGKSGDVVTFVSLLKNCKPIEAAKYLAEQYHVDTREISKTLSMKEYLEKCIQDIRKTDYFLSRGLTPTTIEKFKLGFDAQRNAVVIPYSSDLRYYIARSTTEKKFFKPSTDEAGPEPLYNVKGLYAKKPIFIAESPICALSIMQYEYPAIALCGVSGIHKLIRQVKFHRPSAPLILCLDNDEPGKKATEELRAALKEVKIPFVVFNVAQEKKDPNELLAADPLRLEKSIKDAVEACAFFNTPNVPSSRDVPPAPAKNEKRGFNSFSSYELEHKELHPPMWIIPDFLGQGLSILSAASKIGKSWMSLQLCLSVCRGLPFLGYPTNQSGCLYLALEDSEIRLRGRQRKVLKNEEPPKNFYFAIASPPAEHGFFDALDSELEIHPDIKLVIVDTWQKIRGNNGRRDNAYSADYFDLTPFKVYADAHHICILLIHHIRKMQDEGDVYNRISGSTGIMAVSDSTFMIEKKNRSDENATMHLIGRDIDQKDFVIRFDREKCTWHLVGSAEEEANRRAQAERQNNIIIRTAKALIAEEPYQWSGTATELVKKIADITERAYPGSSTALGKELTRLESDLYDEGVDHKSVRSSQGTLHSFTRRQYYQREQCTSQPTAFDGGPFDEERCPDKEKS